MGSTRAALSAGTRFAATASGTVVARAYASELDGDEEQPQRKLGVVPLGREAGGIATDEHGFSLLSDQCLQAPGALGPLSGVSGPS